MRGGGYGHSVALKSDGTVWAWGLNSQGQLGTNMTSTTPSTSPVQVVGECGVGKLNLMVPVSLTSISLDKTALTLKKGQTAALTVAYHPETTTDDKTITWSSSDSNVLTVDNGAVTARNAGTAIITARAEGKMASCAVTVEDTKIAVTSVKITSPPANMIQGQKRVLKATVYPSNASNKTVTWSSSAAVVAAVNAKTGEVTPKAPGKVTITATADGKRAECEIIVHTYVSLCIGKTTAVQNGNKTKIDNKGAKPFKVSGRTMLPIRFIGEKLGGKVTYQNDQSPIYIKYSDITVELKIKGKTMKVTQGKTTETVTLDVPTTKRGGRVYLPIRAIGQALGFDVKYQISGGGEYVVVNNPKISAGLLKERMDEAKRLIQ